MAIAAAAEADNRVHRWPLTPRITRWLRTKGAAARREGFDADRAALGVEVERDARGHLVMTAVDGPESARVDDAWVLWIHGGGFCWGSARDGTGLRLAAGLGRPVVSVEYPLAPEARFPVAIDVCLEAYLAGVAERGPRVLLGGVSAGANLALGVLQRLRAMRAAGDGPPLPLGVVALTPFGDLAGEGDSYRVNEGRDAWIRWRGQQERFARAYAGGADLRDPLVSPVHADWTGGALPPAILTTGTRDLFLSDTARIHTAWREAGGEADLVLAEGLWHSYLSDARLPESAALTARLLDWCEGVLGRE
ncbi:alpha/beta hydrolase [Janibacter anophelis]|uniref:alpha/beta hydrolase n=1 Tax=Janibacter anophelis TaxID=319054 RepID=UPI000835E738|nr:alpha/beta hydrolase [Janibacter anophelis]